MSGAVPLRVLFFGAWSRSCVGHYVFEQNGRSARGEDGQMAQWLDGREAPGADLLRATARRGVVDPDWRNRVEADTTRGRVSRHGEWWVLAWWDRSADIRSGSNSAILVQQEARPTLDEFRALALKHFPHLAERLPTSEVP